MSKFLLMLNPKFTKSVFYAKMNGSETVVLKSMTRLSENCCPSHSQYSTLNETLQKIVIENSLDGNGSIRNAVFCPGLKSFYLLFKNINDNFLNLIEKKKLWLDVQISIEPLLLKLLASIDGVPIPKLYGSCGDIIVEQFIGNSLSNYYTSHWLQRISISVQLIKMADIFTFSHPSLIFYFADITPDNVAISPSGLTFLVDLDHVIISERTVNMSADSMVWENVHVSSVLDPVKFVISPLDICKHSISDHNYFAVCRYLLIGSDIMGIGLLANIPESVYQGYPRLQELLNECGSPVKYSNRIAASRPLKFALEQIINQFERKKDSISF